MTISLLDYTCRATVSLNSDCNQQVSVTLSLRELPEPVPDDHVNQWPNVYIASHALSDFAPRIEQFRDPSEYGQFEAALGDIWSYIRAEFCGRYLKMPEINIWNYKDSVVYDPPIPLYMKMAAIHTSMEALTGVNVFESPYFDSTNKNYERHCDEFSLQELAIRKIDNMEQRSSTLVSFVELIRTERGQPDWKIPIARRVSLEELRTMF